MATTLDSSNEPNDPGFGLDQDLEQALGHLVRDLAISAGRCHACGTILPPTATYLAGHSLLCGGCRRRVVPALALRGMRPIRVVMVEVPEIT
jgi:recombinational DNA repair protein (RecF pathway)